MLVPNRLRLALPLVLGLPPLDVLTPPPDIRTPPPDAKTILWIRHGQSEANAAGLLGHELLDAQLTDYGRAQAASWASTAPSWEVEQVFCSPLVRSIETAANVFAKADSNLCLTVTPLAREYHFELPENRGRLAAGLLSGTESGETDQAQRWPAVRQFTQRKLARLDELERPLPLRWDPAAEATLTPQAAQKRWRDAIAELPLEIARSDASRIAVVCHYGVMRALCGVDAANAGLLETSMWLGDGGESQMLRRTAVQPPPLAAEESARAAATGRRELLLFGS